jgi:CO dehydrogenase maturation factor
MRIAFVGKGGSGKSTVASLFVRHLRSTHQPVLAIDADINMHLASLLDIVPAPEKALSRDANVRSIRSYLRGDNRRVESVDHFVKTTPPGTGSALVRLREDDPVLQSYAEHPDDGCWFMHVGTYEDDGIGISCYHTNLSVLENVLSHLHLDERAWTVVDMVAGTDAFSNTLHAQFDALALIVEPTMEGVTVYDQYKALATEGGVGDRVMVLGNKVMDEDDASFLRRRIGDDLVAILPYMPEIKRSRQQGRSPSDALNEDVRAAFDALVTRVGQTRVTSSKRLQALHALHRKYCTLPYVVDACGDIEGHIDPDFRFPA